MPNCIINITEPQKKEGYHTLLSCQGQGGLRHVPLLQLNFTIGDLSGVNNTWVTLEKRRIERHWLCKTYSTGGPFDTYTIPSAWNGSGCAWFSAWYSGWFIYEFYRMELHIKKR